MQEEGGAFATDAEGTFYGGALASLVPIGPAVDRTRPIAACKERC